MSFWTRVLRPIITQRLVPILIMGGDGKAVKQMVTEQLRKLLRDKVAKELGLRDQLKKLGNENMFLKSYILQLEGKLLENELSIPEPLNKIIGDFEELETEVF